MTGSEASTVHGASGEETAETVARPSVPRPRAGDAPIILDRYRLHRQLGAGAFGTVWLARDERLERDVAVKIVRRERIVGGRFEREARAAARLSHPGIVTLYEAGADDDGAYLVSELVRGSTLGDLLAAGRLSDRAIIRIGIALCDALGHAHAEHVVHRDVKPSNVLVPDRPSNPASVAKLTDFGVARIVGGDTLTRTGDIVGTAAYMAPEQAEGRDAGPEADLYALSLVLYEGLTGVNPVRTGTAARHARRLGAHLPPLRRQRRDLPRELGYAIDLALRPRPRERGSVEDLSLVLAGVIDLVSDEPGVVAPAWRPGHTDDPGLEPPGIPFAREDLPPPDGPAPGRTPGDRVPAWAPTPEPALDPAGALVPTRWFGRGVSGLATAGLVAWLTATLLPSSPLAPLAAATIAAVLVAALPRAGWFTLVVALAAWLSLAGQTGAALVVVLAGLVPTVLGPCKPSAWPLAAPAPALGAIGLAGAWPALAGRARGALTRAALGATGWIWTMLGSELGGVNLYLRPPPPSLPPGSFTPSAGLTVHHVLAPLITSGALAPAVVWAAAAAILPWLVRGRSLAVDFVLASAWAAGLVATTHAVLRTVHGSLAPATVDHAVLAGVAAFMIALAPTAVRTCFAGRPAARVP